MSQATICGIIALGAIVLMFTKIPRGATATLAVILLILTGVTDYSTAFKQYSSSTIAIMLAMMIVGAALFETGMATYMGKFLLKITGTKETGILLASMAFATFVSAFVSATGAYYLFLPIIVAITLASGISFQRTLYAYMTALMIGQYITLVGGTGNLTSNSMLVELTGEGWGFFELLPYACLFALTLIPGVLFMAKKNIMPNRQVIPAMASNVASKEVPEKISGKMALSGGILLGAMVLMALGIEGLDMHVIAILAALACIITGCVDYKTAISKVDFNALFMVAGMTAVAKCIQSTGLMDQIMETALSNVVGSPFLICVVVYLLSCVGTQFMNNSAWVAVATPIVLPLAAALSVPAKALAGMVLVGSSSAMLTPMSTSLAAPTMEMAEMTQGEFTRCGLVTLVCSLVGALLWAAIFLI